MSVKNNRMEEYSSLLRRCELCPRRCRANRLDGERGFCGVGGEAVVAYAGPHFGEEPPISGTRGSGNIFFASCNLRCVYCQNYQISHCSEGRRLSEEELAEMFFNLEKQGCHNINLVSPTPYIPVIAGAIGKARKGGLTIPFVYNTNAYERVESLQSLAGLIDIYLPDFKYWNPSVASRLSDVRDYPEHARLSLKEMKEQVGDLLVGEDGLARRGLLVRHLVLPGNLAGSRQVLPWIHKELGAGTWISLMSQYYPTHGARTYPMLRRRITAAEYGALTDLLGSWGRENVFVQDLESAPLFVPDFDSHKPFEDERMGEWENQRIREWEDEKMRG
jgi:putative pyruvate formate lyase activating enzyme